MFKKVASFANCGELSASELLCIESVVELGWLYFNVSSSNLARPPDEDVGRKCEDKQTESEENHIAGDEVVKELMFLLRLLFHLHNKRADSVRENAKEFWFIRLEDRQQRQQPHTHTHDIHQLGL